MNLVTGERVAARRRRIRRDLELPVRDAYAASLRGLMILKKEVAAP